MKPKFKLWQTVHAINVDWKYCMWTVVFHKDVQNNMKDDDFAHKYCVESENDVETFMQYDLFDTKKELTDSLWL